MRKQYLLWWGLLAFFGVACLTQICSSGEKKSPAVIRADDLCNGKYVIVGRLGKEYGRVSKVRGVWEYSKGDLPKPTGLVLRITHVDGKRLAREKQVVVDGLYIEHLDEKQQTKESRKAGHVVEGDVIESGGYPRGESLPEVREMLGLRPVQPAYGFAFHSFLYFID
jgi:hypothetical protein